MTAMAHLKLPIYAQSKVEYIQLPVVDFTAPTLEQILEGVAFIENMKKQNKTVYLHCKAGRGRSMVVAICWVIYSRNISAEEAQVFIQVCISPLLFK